MTTTHPELLTSVLIEVEANTTLNWDKHFCRVCEEIESRFVSGSMSMLKATAQVSLDEANLVTINAQLPELVPFALQELVKKQSDGEDGFLPHDCFVMIDGIKYHLVYSPRGQDTVGWALITPS